MLLVPWQYGTEDGYYGPIQESLIQFTGGFAGVVAKIAPHPLAKGIAGAVQVSCKVALYLDAKAERDYRYDVSIPKDYYSMGVVQYY